MKMKKIIPVMVLVSLWLSACTIEFPGGKGVSENTGRSSDTRLKSISFNEVRVESGDELDSIVSEGSYDIDPSVKMVQVFAEPADENAAATVVPKQAVAIAEGAAQKFTITVVAADGTEKVYPIVVNRPQDTSDGVSLSSVVVKEYDADGNVVKSIPLNAASLKTEISSGSEMVSVSAVPKLESSTVSYLGYTDEELIPIGRGSERSIRITVTAEDGASKTYTLIITRPSTASSNTKLSVITAEDASGNVVASIGENFSPSMNLTVAGATAVAVKAQAESSAAEVSVSPNELTPLDKDGTKFTIQVVAENGATGEYALTVVPADSDTSLLDMYVNGVPIGASAASHSVESTVEEVTVEARAKSAGATVSVSPSGAQSIAAGGTKTFAITVTAADKTTAKTYELAVVRRAQDAPVVDLSLASLTVNGEPVSVSDTMTKMLTVSAEAGSARVSVEARASSDSATLSISPSGEQSVPAGSSLQFTVAVSSSSGQKKTYVLTVSVSAVAPPPSGLESYNTDYYWTNKGGAVGTNKTISGFADWTESERIAQCAAYDDPRTWRGIQEVPYDAYALYAAWDTDNLYLMVELSNIVGEMADGKGFMWHDFASSDNSSWWNRDIPLGFSFNTGKGQAAYAPKVDEGGVVWGNVDFTDKYGFDVMLYHSSKNGYDDNKGGIFQGVGIPYFCRTTPAGLFSYKLPYCDSWGNLRIEVHFKDGMPVSDSVYFESTPTGNRAESGQTGQSLLASAAYKAVSPTERSTSYWYKIPLAALGIDKSYLENSGIGVRQLTTGGGSLMDCIPWDVSMVDVAADPYPADQSTSAEKSDVDVITTAMARIGHL